jgi:hypothetical protein
MANLKAADRIAGDNPGTLKTALALRKEALVAAWLDHAVKAYPPETAALLKREGDRFGNPSGHALCAGIRGVVDGLLLDADPGKLAACLEPVLQIRSVQDLPAFRALAFVFMLKDVIVEELGDALRTPGLVGQWFELEARIDQLALLCFDFFTRCRERAHGIHVRAIQRQVSGYLRRFDLACPDDATDAGDARGDDRKA